MSTSIPIPTSTFAEFVLDTNVVVDFLNDLPRSSQRLGSAAKILLPAAVIAEILYGAEKSQQRDANLVRVEAFIADTTILPADLETARIYARVRHQLRIIGRKIPQNDTWIAAAAIRHDRPLVTRDQHFDHVDGLVLARW